MFAINDTDQLLALMNIYLTERCQRDSLMWKQVFSSFTATLIVIVLPYVELWKTTLTDLPRVVFFLCGLLLTAVFFFLAFSSVARFNSVNNIYISLLNKLDEPYRRPEIKDKYPKMIGTLLSIRIAKWFFLAMGIVLVFLNTFLFLHG